ncbi:hypothetical protein C0J52_27861, partial [Blattella germanica]
LRVQKESAAISAFSGELVNCRCLGFRRRFVGRRDVFLTFKWIGRGCERRVERNSLFKMLQQIVDTCYDVIKPQITTARRVVIFLGRVNSGYALNVLSETQFVLVIASNCSYL